MTDKQLQRKIDRTKYDLDDLFDELVNKIEELEREIDEKNCEIEDLTEEVDKLRKMIE